MSGRLVLIASVLGLILVAVSATGMAQPLLLWNTTASAPMGLYRLSPGPVRVGELAAVRPARPLEGWLALRGYLPAGVLLLKRLAAEPPNRICRQGDRLSIDGRVVALAARRDHLGRALPAWTGCQVLTNDQVLLLNDAPGSLDGRYFGPTPRSAIVGRADPLWLSGAR